MENNNDTSGYLKYLDYTLMSGTLPRNIRISSNNTISKNAQRRLRKEYELKTTGKSKKQAKKIIMDFAKELRGGTTNFRNETYAYRFIAQSYNIQLQPIRQAIIKKRLEAKQKKLVSILINFKGYSRSKTGIYVLRKDKDYPFTDTLLPKDIPSWIKKKKEDVNDMNKESPFDKHIVKLIKKNEQNVVDPAPLEWTPIKTAGVMNLDNNVDNAVWCKNRDMCVVDLIQYRYAKRKGFKKKNKTDELIEFWSTHRIDKTSYDGYEIDYEIEEKGLMNPNKTGYTLKHIICWCKNFDVNMVCLIDGVRVCEYYTPLARIKKNPPLIFTLKNSHMYPILDTLKIKAITNQRNNQGEQLTIKSSSIQEGVIKEDENKTNYKIIYKDQDIWDKCNVATRMNYACEMMARDNMMTYPSSNLMLYNGSLNSFKLGDNKYLMFKDVIEDDKCENKTQLLNNQELRCIKQYCVKNNLEYTGQTAPFFIQPYMKDLYKHYSSYYSNSVDKALSSNAIKGRAHWGRRDFDGCEDYWEWTLCYDINKCYRSIMENPSEEWLRITYSNEVVEVGDIIKGGDQKLGLYFIKTNDNSLFHYDNWYSSSIINYALNHTNIEFRITHYISGVAVDKNLLLNIINQVKDDFIDTDLQKRIINCIYGYLMKTESSKTLMNVDEDMNRVFDILVKTAKKNEKLAYDRVETSTGKVLHCYGNKINTKLMNTNLPMAIQITDQANIKLYKMIKKMGGFKKGKLLYRNTDSAVVGYATDSDRAIQKNKMDKYVNNEVGGLSMNYPPLLGDISREKEQLYRMNPDSGYEKNEWNDYTEYNDSDDWLNIISKLVEKGGGMLLGRAGTGKSYVCIKGMEALSHSYNCKALAFTNKATIQLNGSTIHKFMTIDKNGKLNLKWAKNQAKNIDIIFVDEISMISSELWKILAEFKYYTGIIFILIGDFRQLPPVKDPLLAGGDWFNHSTTKYLANYNRIELTKMKRYDIKLWNLLEDIWEGDIGKYKKDTEMFLRKQSGRTIEELVESKNITYCNKTRKHINHIVEEHICPNEFNLIEYDGDKNKYNQNIKIFKGAKLIMYYTTKCKSLKKNEEVEVVDFGNNWIKLTNNNDVKDLIIKWKTNKDFHKKFLLGYATTIHKSQGDTIDNMVNIFDIDLIKDWLLDKRALYTALSRAKQLSNIRPSFI